MYKPVGKRQVEYQGKLLQVVTQDHQVNTDGKVVKFEWVERPPGTRLIIVRDGEILLSKEYRQEHTDYDYRLPGGKVFDRLADYNKYVDSGGDLLEAAEKGAIREASEEVDILVKELDLCHISKSGATVKWDLYYFLVEEFEIKTSDTEIGEEHIRSEWLGIEEVKEMALSGKMKEDRSVGVLLRCLSRFDSV